MRISLKNKFTFLLKDIYSFENKFINTHKNENNDNKNNWYRKMVMEAFPTLHITHSYSIIMTWYRNNRRHSIVHKMLSIIIIVKYFLDFLINHLMVSMQGISNERFYYNIIHLLGIENLSAYFLIHFLIILWTF